MVSLSIIFRNFRRWIRIANLKYQFNEKSQCYKVHDILLAFRCHSILCKLPKLAY